MELPKTITPCPISEALFEFRFEPAVPDEAVFGIVYSSLKDEYPEVEQLPILQIPLALRQQDENLARQAHFKVKNENVTVGIGPRTAIISYVTDYPGWEVYRETIISVLTRLYASGVVKKHFRFGLRYLNTFKFDVADKVNFQATIKDTVVESDEISFRTVLKAKNNFYTILSLMSGVKLTILPEEEFVGSIIDIDVIHESEKEIDLLDNLTLLDEAHGIEKDHFFTIMKEEYIRTLSPTL